MPPPIAYKGSLNDYENESDDMTLSVIRSQLSLTHMVDFGQAYLTVLSTTIIKTANEGKAFGRMVFNTSRIERETWRINAKEDLGCSSWWWPNIL